MMLGPVLMIEMARRCGTPNAPLLRDAGQQAAYCLDAPDEMPGGGVYWFSDTLPEIAGPLERMVAREVHK